MVIGAHTSGNGDRNGERYSHPKKKTNTYVEITDLFTTRDSIVS